MIYLDHAAATPLDPRVYAAMRPFFGKEFGNPSAIYQLGVRARNAIEEARKETAVILNAHSDEIIFTGSGTEANNLAILGSARARKHLGNHLIVSSVEHASIIEPCEQLAKEGFKITYLPVDNFGLVNPEQIKKSLTEQTILVSIMYANNEVGTIEPIAEIGRLISQINKERAIPSPLPSPTGGEGNDNPPSPLEGEACPVPCRRLWFGGRGEGLPIYFHTDAVQAANYLDLNVTRLHVDLLTLNGSKIYGPKGVGLLYKKRGVKLEPLIRGGGQERGYRGGTENPALIVGFARALRLIQDAQDKESKRLRDLRDYFWQKLTRLPLPLLAKEGTGGVVLNGHPDLRLPNNLHISIPGVDGEAMLIYLDEAGVQCSTGAACSLLQAESSRVLEAMGTSREQIQSSLRFTLGQGTTKKDIDYVLKVLPPIARKLRFEI